MGHTFSLEEFFKNHMGGPIFPHFLWLLHGIYITAFLIRYWSFLTHGVEGVCISACTLYDYGLCYEILNASCLEYLGFRMVNITIKSSQRICLPVCPGNGRALFYSGLIPVFIAQGASCSFTVLRGVLSWLILLLKLLFYDLIEWMRASNHFGKLYGTQVC